MPRSLTASRRVRFATLLTIATLSMAAPSAGAQNSPDDAACQPPQPPQGSRTLPSILNLATAGERGEPLSLTLSFQSPQGRPLQNPMVYVYHTDVTGQYRRAAGATGCFRFHGVLHGWARPDAQGKVMVHSIRPGPYPGSTEPAHVHIVVQFPGQQGFYINDVLFCSMMTLDSLRPFVLRKPWPVARAWCTRRATNVVCGGLSVW
jgi:protocatechuate 3,4-dioxygenase beta subunit